jgi:hypothetical protein
VVGAAAVPAENANGQSSTTEKPIRAEERIMLTPLLAYDYCHQRSRRAKWIR